MIALWRNELHDRNRVLHIIVSQIAEQRIGRCHHSIADVWMKLSLVEKLNVVDAFCRIIGNVFCCPVEILGWTTSIGIQWLDTVIDWYTNYNINKLTNKHNASNCNATISVLLVMISPGSTKIRRVEFCLAPKEWLVAYNTVARLCYMWLIKGKIVRIVQSINQSIKSVKLICKAFKE